MVRCLSDATRMSDQKSLDKASDIGYNRQGVAIVKHRRKLKSFPMIFIPNIPKIIPKISQHNHTFPK